MPSAARATALLELRRRPAAPARALTCVGAQAAGPAGGGARGSWRARFAQGGIDYIKDDHGLADQAYSPFAARVEAIAARAARGRRRARATCRACRAISTPCGGRSPPPAAAGVDTVMVAPDDRRLLQFPPAGARASRTSPSSPIPPWAGPRASRPPLLLGKLFRLLGADAVVFPNHGGRFGYSPRYLPCDRAGGARGARRACGPACRFRPAA